MLIQNTTIQAPPLARFSGDGAPISEAVTASPPVSSPITPQAAVEPQATTQTTVPAAQLQSAVQNANLAMQASNRDLAFSVDADTKQTVVKLLDTKTGDVIGQFPTHQMLEISKAIGLMQEQLQQATLTKVPVQSTQGMLVKQEA